MLKMAQSNHRGSSATGKRGGGMRSIEEEKSVMRITQNVKTNRKRTERQKDSLEKRRPTVQRYAPTLLALGF